MISAHNIIIIYNMNRNMVLELVVNYLTGDGLACGGIISNEKNNSLS